MDITIILSLISTTIAICIGVGGYVLKVLAERRSQDSNRAEIDVKLSTLFTELVNVAHARSKNPGVVVGHSSQIAAIIALGELGNRYGILYEPTKTTLTSLKIWLVDFPPKKAESPVDIALAKDQAEALKKASDILEKPKTKPEIKKIIAREGLIILGLPVLFVFSNFFCAITLLAIAYFYIYLLYLLIRFIIWAVRTLREQKTH